MKAKVEGGGHAPNFLKLLLEIIDHLGLFKVLQ